MYKRSYRMNKRSKLLKSLFHRKLDEWEAEERQSLVAKLIEWGSTPVSLGKITLWEMIEKQFQFKAEKMDISPKKVIEYLFDKENAEAWMLAFQLSGV